MQLIVKELPQETLSFCIKDSRCVLKTDSTAVVETRTYNDNNQLTQNVVNDGSTPITWAFTYDLNGNMTSKSASRRCSASVGTNTKVYNWKEDIQLLGVDLNSLSVVDYLYDSSSRMLQRVVDATTTTTSFKALRSLPLGWLGLSQRD